MKEVAYPPKTLQDLEWHRLLHHLSQSCSSELPADACRNLPFLPPNEIELHLNWVAEFMKCISVGDPPPRLPVEPIGEWLGRIRGEGSVPPEGLIDIAANIKLYVAIARYLENRRDSCPTNAARVIPQGDNISTLSLARLAAEIDSSFDPDGAISDSASAELSKLRKRVITLRENLISRLDKLAEREHEILRDRTVTMRNERYVLPMRADAHRRIKGIVHGASGTGATIFIEPEEMVAAGNDLMLTREEIIREEKRILAALCEGVRDQLDEVRYAFDHTLETEILIAQARLCDELKASVPQKAPSGNFVLKEARHPLLTLDGVKVVPTTVRASDGECLIISGPNAGGKTVVLKTVGILHLMLAAGLPLPALPDSRIGIATNVLSDIGDDQSLERNLSTFSAHMTNISAIVKRAEHGCIVLLDEVAAGTDPTEGASLAESLLQELSRLGATTLSTTHFDTLKVRAQKGHGFINAAVGFDMVHMQPTFELRIGTPGSSSALAVAKRFGLPESVIERAKKLLPQGMRDMARAVEALDDERSQLRAEREALVEARSIAEAEERRLQSEITKLKSKQSKMLDSETEALWVAIRSAREKVREAETRVRRRSVKKITVDDTRKEINTIAESLDVGGKLSTKSDEDLPGRPAKTEELIPGQRVYLSHLAQPGIVDSTPRGGRLFVRIGAIKTRVQIDQLRIVDKQGTSPQNRPSGGGTNRKRSAKAPIVDPGQAMRTSENTVDLRGMTVDEAIEATETFLDRALRCDWPAIFVLHGHGTGALRSALRSFLQTSNYVSESRPGDPEEGGDGISVAWLR